MTYLSRAGAYTIFALVLVSYTIQCELAAYLNRTGYTKPFFLLYLTHSSYVLLGPIHYFGCTLLKQPVRPLLDEVFVAIKGQLSVSARAPFPRDRALQRLAAIAVLIALPAGVWYAAIPISQMTTLTALYNLNAFWAYILSIYWAKSENWALRPALAVGIACLGVLVMTYGDSNHEDEASDGGGSTGSVFGDLLGLIAGVLVGVYEVWYKKYIALPPKPQEVPMTRKRASYSRLLACEGSAGAAENGYAATDNETNGDALAHHGKEAEGGDDSAVNDIDNELQEIEEEMYSEGQSGSFHAALLFMTHANFITFMIGVTTLFIFWLPLPLLHWLGWEEFGLPRSLGEFFAVVGVCLGGVIFNAGFMILLAQWGPVVTSVGNLFTLILVAASDEIIAMLNGYNSLSLSTLIGSGFILASFGMLITSPPEHEEEAHKPITESADVDTPSLPHTQV